MKLSRVSRVVRILTALQSEKGYSADDLAKIFGTSRRTVFRDLKQLQAIGVPYRYDSQSGGYSIDPEFFLPPIDLNLQEALSLLMLAHKTAREVQLPFRNSALLAALKIENNLPEKVRRYCTKSLRHISTRLDPRAPTGLLNKIFSKLQNAIVNKKKGQTYVPLAFRKGRYSTKIMPVPFNLQPASLVYSRIFRLA